MYFYTTYITFIYYLPFEPILFPKLQINFADFPYLRYAIKTPEASNLEDLMRLSVRNGLKMKKRITKILISFTILILQLSLYFLLTTHYFSWNNKNTHYYIIYIFLHI